MDVRMARRVLNTNTSEYKYLLQERERQEMDLNVKKSVKDKMK